MASQPARGKASTLASAKQLDAASGMKDRWRLVEKIFWKKFSYLSLVLVSSCLVAVKLEDLEVKLTHPPLPLHQQVQHSFHMQKRKSYMHASFQQQQK